MPNKNKLNTASGVKPELAPCNIAKNSALSTAEYTTECLLDNDTNR